MSSDEVCQFRPGQRVRPRDPTELPLVDRHNVVPEPIGQVSYVENTRLGWLVEVRWPVGLETAHTPEDLYPA